MLHAAVAMLQGLVDSEFSEAEVISSMLTACYSQLQETGDDQKAVSTEPNGLSPGAALLLSMLQQKHRYLLLQLTLILCACSIAYQCLQCCVPV